MSKRLLTAYSLHRAAPPSKPVDMLMLQCREFRMAACPSSSPLPNNAAFPLLQVQTFFWVPSAMGFPWRAVWSRADPRSGGSGVEGQRGGTGIEGKGDRRGTGVVQDQLTHPKAKQGAPGTRAKRGLQGPRGEQSSSRSRPPGEKSGSFCPPLGV